MKIDVLEMNIEITVKKRSCQKFAPKSEKRRKICTRGRNVRCVAQAAGPGNRCVIVVWECWVAARRIILYLSAGRGRGPRSSYQNN